MREKLLAAAKFSWNYINSNVGAALIGATAMYVITKGSTEVELSTAKSKLNNKEKEIYELGKALKESDSRISVILQSKIENSFDLQNCLRKKEMLKYAYDNSSCFFRHKYTEEIKNSEFNQKKVP